MKNLFHGRVRWLLIFWMFVMSAMAYLDRVNISIAAQTIQKEYGFTDVQLGWIFSAFVAGYALSQAPGGRLADRFGPRVVIAFGVIWWGVFTSLTAAVPAGVASVLWVLIAVRFLLGVGEAVVYPSSNRLVAAWVPSAERGLANGLIFTGVGAGAAITPPLIAYVLLNYGWRWSFWVSALIGVLGGMVWFILARDTPQKHPWISPEELQHIESGLPESAAGEAGGTLPWSAILGHKDLLVVTLSYFTYGYTAFIFFSWFFIYLSRVRGLDLKSSAIYSMLPFMAMAICSLAGGWISDRLTLRYGRRVGRCGIAVFGIGLAAVFVALSTQVASPRLASIVLAGGAGALYLSQSSFWSVTADIAGSSSGSASGVMNMGGQTGSWVTAWLTPLVALHFGWTASFLLAAALCAAGSLAWLLVDPAHEMVPRPRGAGCTLINK
jgi:ACS family glucarate transporter-like MFS transporter